MWDCINAQQRKLARAGWLSKTPSRLTVATHSQTAANAGLGLLQLVEQFDREVGEIIDEVEWVLDLMGNTGRKLTERGHLLGLDQTGLRRLKITIGCFGSVPSRSDFGLRPFAFGNVAVDQHNATRLGWARSSMLLRHPCRA
jgi:hypothetical protein